MSSWFLLLQLYAWIGVALTLAFYLHSLDEWAYRIGKFTVVFYAGVVVGMGV